MEDFNKRPPEALEEQLQPQAEPSRPSFMRMAGSEDDAPIPPPKGISEDQIRKYEAARKKFGGENVAAHRPDAPGQPLAESKEGLVGIFKKLIENVQKEQQSTDENKMRLVKPEDDSEEDTKNE
jgi:hypothetical protein